jgi:proteasome lid subunit RPN8/RPN11
MSVRIAARLIDEIRAHAERHYPEEGAGLLLGSLEGDERTVRSVLPLDNSFEPPERGRRYQIDPSDMLKAEQLADQRGMSVVGVFHSHPDHPPTPSRFDEQWAVPWYSYLITTVHQGTAGKTRAWRMDSDQQHMVEETLAIEQEAG